jgi:hypothetical protein
VTFPRPDERIPDDPGPTGRLRGADAFWLHLTLILGLAVCIAAFVFEVSRALGGNSLSWAYVFEWPIFAAFAVYMWWQLLHGQDGSRRKGPRSSDVDGTGSPSASGAVTEDADLLAWQEYLRTMEADEARRAEDHTD